MDGRTQVVNGDWNTVSQGDDGVDWGWAYQELWSRLGMYSKARNIEAERTCV